MTVLCSAVLLGRLDTAQSSWKDPWLACLMGGSSHDLTQWPACLPAVTKLSDESGGSCQLEPGIHGVAGQPDSARCAIEE